MQGPFTEYAVGGHQSRHVKLNEGSDSSTNRPEAWKILLGTCDGIPSGAIGMAGPDYPDPATPLVGEEAYPYTLHEKAVYYRDMTAKRPVNIRNIQMKTGSTILGNYRNTYDYVQAPGAFANPRHFVDNQPDLPDRMFVNNATSSMISRTILDIHRTSDGHTENVEDYNTEYLDGTINKSVIISRFNAVGGIEVQTRGYQDIRAGEFSVYNSLNNRYLTVIKPTQGPSGTISTAATSGDTTNIQVFDIHGKDYGLYSHLARHTARFGRDSLFESAPGTSYTELPGFHKVHRNNFDRRSIEYCFESRDMPGFDSLKQSKSLFFTRSNLAAVVNNVLYLGESSAGETVRTEHSFDANWAPILRNGKSVTYSISTWLKFPDNNRGPQRGAQESIKLFLILDGIQLLIAPFKDLVFTQRSKG